MGQAAQYKGQHGICSQKGVPLRRVVARTLFPWVESGVMARRGPVRGHKILEAAGGRILGGVLNKCDAPSEGRYAYNGSHYRVYYRGSHYGSYQHRNGNKAKPWSPRHR